MSLCYRSLSFKFHLLLLIFSFQLHENQKALKDAENSLQENPGDLDSYIVAGQAATALGQFKEAFNYFKVGLQLDPKHKVSNK